MTVTSYPKNDYDVVVVGARCAGASTAMLLARQGMRVLVVERGREGSDTLSTHALMRGAVLQLSRWGLVDQIEAAGTPAIRSTSFYYGADERIDVAIKERDGVRALYAPRRTVLDPILVDAARQAGVEFLYGWSVVELARDQNGGVCGVTVKGNGRSIQVGADLVIGADGIRSTTASLVGAPVYRQASHATGVIFSYWSGLEIEGFHWFYRPGASAGAIHTNDGLTCIFASTTEARFRQELASDIPAGFRRVLSEAAPELADSVPELQRAEGFRSFPGIKGFFRQSWGQGWALVGDSGYFRDPLTAHGITDALRDAELLSRAVLQGTPDALADYQSRRDALASGFFEATDAISSFEWDLPTVKQLHLNMSREMNREVDALLEIHAGSGQGLRPCKVA